MRGFGIGLGLLVALAAGGCDIDAFGEGLDGCTLIGCHDTLTVSFSPPIDDDYDVQIILDGRIIGFDCKDGQVLGGGGQVIDCDASGFRVLSAAKQVDVAASGNIAKWEAFGKGAPHYEAHRPNGPDCDPVCQSGAFSVQTEQL